MWPILFDLSAGIVLHTLDSFILRNLVWRKTHLLFFQVLCLGEWQAFLEASMDIEDSCNDFMINPLFKVAASGRETMPRLS